MYYAEDVNVEARDRRERQTPIMRHYRVKLIA